MNDLQNALPPQDGPEQDYKYILDNLSFVQIGSHYTYDELEENFDLSYKYRCIIKQIILQEVDGSTTLESHLYYMKPQEESTKVYARLKVKIRAYYPVTRDKKNGERQTVYREKVYRAEELAALTPQEKNRQGLIISEIQIPKVGLMTFVL